MKKSFGIKGMLKLLVFLFDMRFKLKKITDENDVVHYFSVHPLLFAQESRVTLCGQLQREEVYPWAVLALIEKALVPYFPSEEGSVIDNPVILNLDSIDVKCAMTQKNHLFFVIKVPIDVFIKLAFLKVTTKVKRDDIQDEVVREELECVK
jgi:hypothetical protein